MNADRARLMATVLASAVCGVTALAGCSGGGKPLQESCQGFFSRYTATNTQAYASDIREFSNRLGALYEEAAQAGDADAKKVFEPAAAVSKALGNGDPYSKSSHDALTTVTAACAPWAPKS